MLSYQSQCHIKLNYYHQICLLLLPLQHIDAVDAAAAVVSRRTTEIQQHWLLMCTALYTYPDDQCTKPSPDHVTNI